MAELFSFPFRMTPAGAASKVTADSDQARGERIAMLVLTRKGERPLVPDMGITDPLFSGFEPSEVSAELARWAPDTALANIDVDVVSPDSLEVLITFS